MERMEVFELGRKLKRPHTGVGRTLLRAAGKPPVSYLPAQTPGTNPSRSRGLPETLPPGPSLSAAVRLGTCSTTPHCSADFLWLSRNAAHQPVVHDTKTSAAYSTSYNSYYAVDESHAVAGQEIFRGAGCNQTEISQQIQCLKAVPANTIVNS